MPMWGKWRMYDRQEFEEGKSNPLGELN